MSPGIFVVGIGNVFLGDDGFGVEAVRALVSEPLPEGVRVADFGIRGLHLAFELLDRPDEMTILVDATPRGGDPGTVYLIEPDLEQLASASSTSVADAHGMTPDVVFRLIRNLGGNPGRVLIVGCEPLRCEEEMGLSPPVQLAIAEAVALIREVVDRELKGMTAGASMPCSPDAAPDAARREAGSGSAPEGETV
jgi:hydrogenase maturation protease